LAEQGSRDFGEGLRAGGFAVEAFEEGDELVGVGGGLEVAEGDLEQRAIAGRTAGDVGTPRAGPAARPLAMTAAAGSGSIRLNSFQKAWSAVADREARDVVQLRGGAAGLVAAGDAGRRPCRSPRARMAAPAMVAMKAWLEQMLDVALSLRMCCSRVDITITMQSRPALSLALPTKRPGVSRTSFFLSAWWRTAKRPRPGPPKLAPMAEVLAFADEDVGPFPSVTARGP
jgi:hypothetical protein